MAAAVKKTLLWAAALAVVGYAAALAALTLNQSAHIFKPTSAWTQTPDSAGLVYEDVRFRADDGVDISAWFAPAENARAVVLFCHGNSRNMSSDVDVMKMFNRLGLSVLIFDYRGYGKSSGAPSEQGIYRDTAAAWAYLTETRKIAPADILVWGRSLGASPAVEAALRYAPRGLVIEAAFTSLPDVASSHYPIFPVRLILKTHFDNIGKIAKIRCPLLVVHSREDTVIPIRHGRALFERAHDPKQFLEIVGPHKGLPWQPGYEEGLRAFLDSL